MGKKVKVATIQPPIPEGEKGIYYLEKVGNEKVDIVCLPEVFNIFGLSVEEAIDKAKAKDNLKEKI